MTTPTRPGKQAASEAPPSSSDASGRESSWWLALLSVGVCLGTGATIALVAILA
jgi:hypothetical protein